MPNVLVTGANGFIGKALCRRMLAEGWHVRAAIRSFAKKDVLPKGVEIVESGTIDSDTKWGPAVDGMDAVVHLAAKVHVKDESSADPITEYRKINVAATKQIAQISGSFRSRRFIYMSSIKVNGEGKSDPYAAEDRPAPADPYALSKLEAEQELLRIAGKTGLELVVLRPPLVYGPEVKANFLQLIKLIDRGIPLPLAKVKNHRSFIFLGNLVDALLVCLVHPKAAGKTFVLSDNIEISTPELIQKISAALGKPSRLFPFPPDLLRLMGRVTRRSKTVSRLLDTLMVDNTKIQAELGWNPPYAMEEGLKETIRWYQKIKRRYV